METAQSLQRVRNLTTTGQGTHPDAEALVYQPPKVTDPVPGWTWAGPLGKANVVIRLPDEANWNGKLMIGGIPAVRSEYALDTLLSDIVLQRGYAYAASDKATPGGVLLDPRRRMTEWMTAYKDLTDVAKGLVKQQYGRDQVKTYIAGVSNGGYVVRRMMELYPDDYDGGVEWEGTLWHKEGRHILTTLPACLTNYPIYANWRGDATEQERHKAWEQLLEAGLHPDSAPHWNTYFMVYWAVSLWLYGRNLDNQWTPFQSDWSNEWLRNPSLLANYPWQERLPLLKESITPLQNTGSIQKPLLSVAGNWDCLLPFEHHAAAYGRLVEAAGRGQLHRMYEINRGNHVDGLLRTELGKQQPILPFFEASLLYLEQWVESGQTPPESGMYDKIDVFAEELTQQGGAQLYSMSSEHV